MALFRLCFRPIALVYFYFVLMAVASPVLRLEDVGGNPFVLLWTAAELPLVQSVRWQLAVLVPAALGLWSLLLRLEVMTSGLGWTLPGVRRGWLVGELMLLAPLAVGLGVLAAQGTTVVTGCAAAGVGVIAFNLPSLILHPNLPKWWFPSLLALLVGGAVFPAQLSVAGAAMPAFVAALTVPAAVVMLRVRYSDWAARGSVTWGADGERNWMLRRFSPRGEWSTSLATDHRTPWLRAVFYEAGFGSTSRTVKMRSMGVSVLVVMTYVFMDYYMLMLWAGMVAGSERTDGLTGGLLYPVSRGDRGRIMATALLLDAAFTLALLFGGSWLLDALPLPFERSHFSPDRNYAIGIISATAVALLPIVLWGRVRHMSSRRLGAGGVKGQLTSFLCLLGFALIAGVVMRLLQGAWNTGSYWLVGGSLALTAIVLYSLFWSSTLRYYHRRDLTVPSS